MKLARKAVLTVIAGAMFVGRLLYAAPSANLPVVVLKPLVQVSGDSVTLGDLVANAPLENVAEKTVVCRAPEAGTVRVLGRSEVASALKKQGLSYALQGAEQVGITRAGRRIVAEDLAPLVQTALKGANATAKVGNIQLQANVLTDGVPEFSLQRLKFDPAIAKYRAWFVAQHDRLKINFEATVTLAEGSAPLEINLNTKSIQAAKTPLLVRRGQEVTMQLGGQGFAANVPVTAMNDGAAGKVVRVRDKAAKRNYRAEVIAGGLVRAIRQEN
jgi:hypothetical protein